MKSTQRSAHEESATTETRSAGGLDDGLWSWDIATNVTIVSEKFKELLSIDSDEFHTVFLPWSSRLHPQDFDRTMDALVEHLENRVPFNVEYRLRGADGEYQWYSTRGQAIWDTAGNAKSMSGTLRLIDPPEI